MGLKMYRRGLLNDMERHQIAREIWLHIQLNHPSIIALYSAWKDRDYIYLVLEWAPEVRRGLRGVQGSELILVLRPQEARGLGVELG